jgi:hypothetical protein
MKVTCFFSRSEDKFPPTLYSAIMSSLSETAISDTKAALSRALGGKPVVTVEVDVSDEAIEEAFKVQK